MSDNKLPTAENGIKVDLLGMVIDFDMLKQQKLSLLHVIDNLDPAKELHKDLTGILNLIDAIQDAGEPIDENEEVEDEG